MNLRILGAIGSFSLLLATAPAFAGMQYVDGTGFAASGYDVVAYSEMQQSPIGEHQPPAVPGKSSIAAEYNGAKFAFATEENRDRFIADPAKYAPQFDGHCAYGIAQGGKVPGNPDLWRIVGGKLYLNITKDVAGLWEADIDGNLASAAKKWREMENTPASTDAVPELDGAKAPVTQ